MTSQGCRALEEEFQNGITFNDEEDVSFMPSQYITASVRLTPNAALVNAGNCDNPHLKT